MVTFRINLRMKKGVCRPAFACRRLSPGSHRRRRPPTYRRGRSLAGRLRKSPAKNGIFAMPFIYKNELIILPRQARDKHRESTQKKIPFSLLTGRSIRLPSTLMCCDLPWNQNAECPASSSALFMKLISVAFSKRTYSGEY
jgi:hypothetical protein